MPLPLTFLDFEPMNPGVRDDTKTIVLYLNIEAITNLKFSLLSILPHSTKTSN